MKNLIKHIKDESGRVIDFEVIREETSLNQNYVCKEKVQEIKYEGLRK